MQERSQQITHDRLLWEGLAHRPVAVLQSGGLGRRFPHGEILRSKDDEVRRFRRALSQSVFYFTPSSTTLNETSRSAEAWATLESAHEILQRGELCAPHPEVEAIIRSEFASTLDGDAEWPSLKQAIELFRSWASSQLPRSVPDPIDEFDDEPDGARLERGTWERFQNVGGGVLRRWSHPQVEFRMLGPSDYSTDSRRADFVVCPPTRPPLVWEVHGEFDLRDSDKDSWIRKQGLETFNQVAGVTQRDEIAKVLETLIPGRAKPRRAGESLDAYWIASQIDLSLLYLLTHQIWSDTAPRVSIAVPSTYLEIASNAIRHFEELIRALQAIWSVNDASRPLTPEMRAMVRPLENANPKTAVEVEVEIDPLGGSYLGASEELAAGKLIVRRMCLPCDVGILPIPTPDESTTTGLHPRGEMTDSTLRPILQRLFGFETFRPGQVEGIRHALIGKDSLILLPTGHGKSLIFQLAALILPGSTLVIEAWRALLDDQVRALQDHGWSRTIAIHADRRLSKDSKLEQAHMIYVAPERLFIKSFQKPFENLVKRRGLDLMVVDEAHAVSEAGHSFRPSYLGLVDRVHAICERQGAAHPTVLALTATASQVVVRDTCGILGISTAPVSLSELAQSTDGPELEEWAFVRTNLADRIAVFPAEQGEHGMREALADALGQMEPSAKGVIFCSSKRRWSTGSYGNWFGVGGTVDELSGDLRERAEIAYYVGGDTMEASDRRRHADDFVNGRRRVMVATSAFGTGIDIPDIDWTIHIGFPSGLEAYYQELGRAGRDGRTATGVLIVDRDDDRILDALRRAGSEPDSFDALRRVLQRRSKGRGSIVRQLQLMIGKRPFRASKHMRPDKDTQAFLPSFPGWNFERTIVDTYVVDAILAGEDHEIVEITFQGQWDAFVWKSVHRMRELEVIHADYERTSHRHGLNSFFVRRTQLDEKATAESLTAQLRRVLTRLRGREAEPIARECLHGLEKRETARDRILFASATLLRNTYEVVRSMRLGSMIQLLSYSATESPEERRRQIEDYFVADAYVTALTKLAEGTQSIATWQEALVLSDAEPYWRTGAINRLATDHPTSSLLRFLLLIAEIKEGRTLQTSFYLRDIAEDMSTSWSTFRWAVHTLLERATEADTRDVFVEVAEKLLTEMENGETRHRLVDALLYSLPDEDGIQKLAHQCVGNWFMEEAS